MLQSILFLYADKLERDCVAQEFDAQLKKMLDGDMTLVSSLGQLKLALEAAIKSAFQTPEVIRMFAKREPAALRLRLARLHEDHKLGRLPEAAFRTQAVEVIVALKKLGEEVRASPTNTQRLAHACVCSSCSCVHAFVYCCSQFYSYR